MAEATHIRGGYLKIKLLNNFTYAVTLHMYTNPGSVINPGDGKLDFGDKSPPVTTPSFGNTFAQSSKVGYYEYTITHTFPRPGAYLITYLEPNLDAGIVNISNSVERPFYIETQIVLDGVHDCSSPDFLVDPFFFHSVGKSYSLANAAVSQRDYQLLYELVTPLQPKDSGYTRPQNMELDPYNGLLTWDTQHQQHFQAGEYFVAVRVSQYDNDGGKIGHNWRSFQILLDINDSDIDVMPPTLESNNRFTVTENQNRILKTLLTDNILTDSLNWIVSYDKKIQGNLVFTQYDSVAGKKTFKVGLLKLSTTPDMIRDNPYAINLRGISNFASKSFNRDITYLYFTKAGSTITEIKNQSVKQFSVYPNPFINNLYVESANRGGELNVALMNVIGETLFQATIVSGSSIEGYALPPGIYFLQVRSALGTYCQRVIKK